MRRTAAEKRTGGIGVKALDDRERRPQRVQAESRHEKWMARQEPERAEDLVEERTGVADERRHQRSP